MGKPVTHLSLIHTPARSALHGVFASMHIKISYSIVDAGPYLVQQKPDEAAVHRRHGSACDHA